MGLVLFSVKGILLWGPKLRDIPNHSKAMFYQPLVFVILRRASKGLVPCLLRHTSCDELNVSRRANQKARLVPCLETCKGEKGGAQRPIPSGRNSI